MNYVLPLNILISLIFIKLCGDPKTTKVIFIYFLDDEQIRKIE